MDQSYDTLLDTLRDQILAFADLTPHNQWTQELAKDGFTVHSRINPDNGLKINRTETKQDVSLEAFMDLVFDISQRAKYDQLLEEARVLKHLSENQIIVYGRGKAPLFLIAPRDFIWVSKRYRLPDGSQMMVAKSIPYPEIPEMKGVVRAELLMSFCHVKRISDTETSILVIGNIDPRGQIPKILVNQAAKFEADGLKKTIDYARQASKGQQQQAQQQQ